MSETSALQQTLAGEHAAVFVYGVLGGATSASEQPRLADALAEAYQRHRNQRDALAEMVRAAGGTPEPAAVSYHLPRRDTPAAVAAAAREVEHACAATYAELVAASTGDHRRWGVTALEEAAVRALGFGDRPEDFPGLDEFSGR